MRCLRIWRLCLFSFQMLNGENRLHFLTGILERVCTILPSVANPTGEELLAKHPVLVHFSPFSKTAKNLLFPGIAAPSSAQRYLPRARSRTRNRKRRTTFQLNPPQLSVLIYTYQTSYTLKIYINVYWQIFSPRCCSCAVLKSKCTLNPYN